MDHMGCEGSNQVNTQPSVLSLQFRLNFMTTVLKTEWPGFKHRLPILLPGKLPPLIPTHPEAVFHVSILGPLAPQLQLSGLPKLID